ncbi:MAG: sigma-54 dependent transcriptional regulator [Oligoflexia bacterium]|nr:sigma-54 dependent transcriptional regulator [Oligoflexia bacterium]
MLAFRSPLVGESLAIQNVLKTIEKVSQTDSTVLITGESGTGKELFARAIHEASPRAGKALVVVNCGAIPPELLEAELFGHVKGAFTGAVQARQGRFELAHGGTIFLDEVGELPLHLQVKLLRVIQTRTFEAVGSSKTVEVDVRIIAATNRDLEEAVRDKEFREDLYYRLNVIPVRIPSLRERKSDIPLLVNHFVQQFNQITGHAVEAPSGAIMDALLAYDWPGNVRELENLMERIVILKGQGSVDLGDLPHRLFQKYTESRPSGEGATAEWEFPRMVLPQQGLDLKSIVAAFENHLVDQALARTNGNKNRASELLQMNRTTLVEKLRKRGMIVPAAQSRAEAMAEVAEAIASNQVPTGATTGATINNGGNNANTNPTAGNIGSVNPTPINPTRGFEPNV